MILPLELLCQAVLFYETFKALKAPPPPRKRRNANAVSEEHGGGHGPAPKQTTYAANKRKRAMKVMLRAWLIYAVAIPLETILDYAIGWLLPFYSSFRTMAVFAFIAYHKTAGDIGYSHFLVPFLKPREPSLDWICAWLNEVLDVACYIVVLIAKRIVSLVSLVLLPVRRTVNQVSSSLQEIKARLQLGSSTANAEEAEGDTTLLQVPSAEDTSETPRRSKHATKPRYSQIATPYVPGHLVTDESVYPPVQPRLHPAERSADDVSAFQEAMDRAQAAFYEVSSPVNELSGHAESSISAKDRNRAQQEKDPFLPLAHRTGSKTRSNGKRTRQRLSATREETPSDEPAAVALNGTSQLPSAKALGKRRQVTEDTMAASAAPEVQGSPEKVIKVGTFEDSRRQSMKAVNGESTRVRKAPTRSRPARPKTQATSKLPTRQAARAEQGSAKRPVISESGHLAREAAIRGRRESQRKSKQMEQSVK